jgi:TolB protein
MRSDFSLRHRLSPISLGIALVCVGLSGWLGSIIAVAPTGGGRQSLPVAVAPISGTGGPAASTKVRQLLERTSPFQLSQAAAGLPVVGGAIGTGYLEGRLVSGNGRELFQKKYQLGNLDRDTRQFADDVVLTLTKRPGIATSQIAFTFSESGKPYQIYVCDFDGGNVRQVTREGAHVAPSISADGTMLAHVELRQGGPGMLRVINLATGKALPLKSVTGQRIEVAFSPDGEQLALSMGADAGPNSDLFVVKLPRGKAEPLTRTPVPESSPSWSPDGRRLVFAAAPAPGRSDLFILDLRKKSTLPLPTGYPVAIDPAWSPDGALVAFVAVAGGQRTLCVRDLATGHTRRLTEGSQPVWGADSRHLLYSTQSGLSMVQIDSGKIFPVIVGGGRAIDPSWTR